MTKRWTIAVLAVAVGVTISGCTASPSPFDGERKASDELPAPTLSVLDGADPSTSYYQGRADGLDLYLVRGKPPIGFCLVYTDGTAERTGDSCSGGDWVETQLAGGSTFRVQLTGFTDKPARGEADLSRWVRQIGSVPQPGDG